LAFSVTPYIPVFFTSKYEPKSPPQRLDIMKIAACSQCGSTNLRQGSIRDGLLSGLTSKYVCRDCNFQGMPFIFDSEEDYINFVKCVKNDKKER